MNEPERDAAAPTLYETLRHRLRFLKPWKERVARWGPLTKLLSLRYALPWSPYRRMSDEDRETFRPVLSAWLPEDEPPVILLRWMATEWCNYKCPYCTQTHSRFARKVGGTAHAFDNYSLEAWREAFLRHFQQRRLSLLITGGEPMLDRKNMVPLLETLTGMPTVEWIRIDTNASWDPAAYDGTDKSKIILMCTFHPSQVDEERFFARIEQLRAAGFRIGMVNYVMNRENIERYERIRREMEELGGPPLHPNPLWDSRGVYSSEDLALMERELPEADFLYRAQVRSPEGRKCLYPALAYEMDQTGRIQVGCHPWVAGSFFDRDLPRLFAGPVPCPASACTCLDKYSFLEDVNRNVTTNPLGIYSDLLAARGGRRGGA